MAVIETIEQLEAIYGEAGEASLIKEIDHLTLAYTNIINKAQFCALATSGPEGLDCSPRGDNEPIVRIVDPQTLHLPDRRGNNRIDSLRNIVRDPRVALMFMVGGWNNVLRVNGTAAISSDKELLDSFVKEGKAPRTVIVIKIQAVYLQCARAVMRAGLWNPNEYVASDALPTPGQIMQEIKSNFDGKTYDTQWPARAAKSMW